MEENNNYEVIIIGGSYAGLSAAMALGRSLRNVLLIDSGLPCNRYTPHSHNFITQDGQKPQVIAEIAKFQVLKYPTITFQNALAVSGKQNKEGFFITTDSGQKFKAKKLIFATGIKDDFPNIKGFEACWGISVIHCPYCHGYEFLNQPTGIMANGDRAFHIASLVNNLTKQLTLFTNGEANFNEEQFAKLKKHNIEINENIISGIDHENGNIKSVVFNNGTTLPMHALYASLPFKQHSDIPFSLGCELTELGYIKVDSFQKTTIDGVFACGDNASMMRAVANAVYTGNLTGAIVNKELTEERF